MTYVITAPHAVVMIEGRDLTDEEFEYVLDRHTFLKSPYFAGMIVPEPRDPFALAGWGTAHSEETALSMEYCAAWVNEGEDDYAVMVTIIAHGSFWPLLQAVYEAVTGACVHKVVS